MKNIHCLTETKTCLFSITILYTKKNKNKNKTNTVLWL